MNIYVFAYAFMDLSFFYQHFLDVNKYLEILILEVILFTQ